MSDPIESAIVSEHNRQERAWEEAMTDKDAELKALAGRREFPGGYFGCCGMSRARGHAELCHRNTRAGEKA